VIRILLVAFGAGAASAFLLTSLLSGSLLSIFLFCLAPLPILIAAVSFSHWAGLIAAALAGLGLAAAVGSAALLLTYLLGIGLPAWWLGYLALLARPGADGVEWYPAERLLLWCAGLAALMIVLTIPNFGLDEEQFRANLRKGFQTVLFGQGRPGAGAAPVDPASPEGQRLLDFLVAYTPIMAAVLTTLTNSGNLYLAGRIARISGRLNRPWPDLAAIRFPPTTHAAFAASIVLSFVPGLPGTVAGIAAGALSVAYGLVGLAVLHALTRPLKARSLVLTGVYSALMFFWPAIVLVTLIGIADALFDFRKRTGTAGPPAPPQRN
jgi:hypothetical protein